MAFGLMTKKWGILQRPLTNSLPSIKHLICSIARLHNFCIDERLGTNTTISTNATTRKSTTINYSDSLPTSMLAEMNEAAQVENREILSEEYPHWSHARENIVQAVKQLGLKRPVINRKRKRMSQESAQGSHSSPSVVQAQYTGPALQDDSAPSVPPPSPAPIS